MYNLSPHITDALNKYKMGEGTDDIVKNTKMKFSDLHVDVD